MKEHFHLNQVLIGKQILLDLYSDMDWVMR